MARFERPTTLSAQFDQTLGTANCETVYFGDRVGYWSLACIQETEHLVGEGDASAQGKGFREIALQYTRDHRDRVPYVVAARVGRTFGLYQPQEQILLDTRSSRRSRCSARSGLFTWYGIAVAGAVGLVGLRRAGRPIFPLVAIVGSVVVTVAVIYGNTRFRLPAELALMFPAAVSLDAALGGLRRRWAPGRRAACPRRRRPSPPLRPPTPRRRADAGTDGPPAAEDASGDTAADPPGGLGSSSGRFAGFDGLRALAALGVLVTHVALKVGFTARDAPATTWPGSTSAWPSSSCCRASCCTGRSWPAASTAGPGPRTGPTCATGSCASSPPTGWRSPCSWWCSTCGAATTSRASGTSSRTTACCRATRPTPRSAGCSRRGR